MVSSSKEVRIIFFKGFFIFCLLLFFNFIDLSFLLERVSRVHLFIRYKFFYFLFFFIQFFIPSFFSNFLFILGSFFYQIIYEYFFLFRKAKTKKTSTSKIIFLIILSTLIIITMISEVVTIA